MNDMIIHHPLRPLSPEQLEVLMRDLDQWRVAQRATPGSSKKMSYLEGHDVKATLTRVFGFGGYSADLLNGNILRLEEIEVAETRWDDGAKKKVPVMVNGVPKMKRQWRAVATATLRLYIHQLGSTYTEMAVSSQQGVDPGEVSDFAIKTAETDALKRCAINLGTQFGLSLYQDGQTTDSIVVIFEPEQAAALAAGRQKVYDAWAAQNGQQQAAVAAPQQPQGAPGAPAVPQGAIAPGTQAHGAALAQMQQGINHQ